MVMKMKKMIDRCRGLAKTVPLETVLQMIQDDLCQDCIVRQFSNRRCDRCANNLIKQLAERVEENG